ncbi:MAG: Glycosyl transferase family 2 [Firmicutes bacterium ADurb.Bin419]|nr:MAG: Glycosyl transferase family 2 [Firmicutes bacterium ADurb.Bin419]
MKRELTDVIMLCYQPFSKTYKAIKSILETTTNINLIIVNAKQSCATNRNEWLNRSISKEFVICDDDIIVRHNWLEEMKKCLKDDVGIVGCKMINQEGKIYDIPQNLKEGEVYELNGGLLLYKNIGLKADETYQGSQWEDTDLQWQYKEKGYKLWSTHNAEFTHDITRQKPNDEANQKIFESKWGEK